MHVHCVHFAYFTGERLVCSRLVSRWSGGMLVILIRRELRIHDYLIERFHNHVVHVQRDLLDQYAN